jgi:hypothetical protein
MLRALMTEVVPENADSSARIAAAERAFEVGDLATARSLAGSLVSDANGEVSARAKVLRDRLAIDPVQIGVLVVCTLFFAWVVVRYVF